MRFYGIMTYLQVNHFTRIAKKFIAASVATCTIGVYVLSKF